MKQIEIADGVNHNTSEITDPKFFYRRGVIQAALGEYSESYSDLLKAYELQPLDMIILKKLKQVKR
jgi:hypothetical protein